MDVFAAIEKHKEKVDPNFNRRTPVTNIHVGTTAYTNALGETT